MVKPTDALLDDLRSAKEGSRELSDRVLLAMGWRLGFEAVFGERQPEVLVATSPSGQRYIDDSCPHPTGSLDDAVGLVLEEYRVRNLWQSHYSRDDPWWGAAISRSLPYRAVEQRGLSTLPLAICAALVTIKIAEANSTRGASPPQEDTR